LLGFARGSPIGDLIRLGAPEANVIGLLIAIAEIGIGLGALSGLAYRIAAAGGAALSFLFFLTVSWTTHPYSLGSDLPYAIGWLTLALAGHGGLFVPGA
jgi:thiosulfate dehydrogenase [quinone] large subunit